jgi:hypothetical protein
MRDASIPMLEAGALPWPSRPMLVISHAGSTPCCGCAPVLRPLHGSIASAHAQSKVRSRTRERWLKRWQDDNVTRRPARGGSFVHWSGDSPSFAQFEGRSKEAPLSLVGVIRAQAQSAQSPARDGFETPFIAKTLLLAVTALAFAGGMLVTDSTTTAQVIAGAGRDWANLLRAMAVLKLLFAGAVTAAIIWRLGAPISATKWSGYAVAVAAIWAGPGLIWGLAHIVLGTLLLHGGLIAAAVLVWRDPATRARLSAIIASRRGASRARG